MPSRPFEKLCTERMACRTLFAKHVMSLFINLQSNEADSNPVPVCSQAHWYPVKQQGLRGGMMLPLFP